MLMKIKLFILSKVTLWLLGNDNVFERIQLIVNNVEGAISSRGTQSGERKKAEAIKQIKSLGVDLSDFLINLGIEVAVTVLKYSDEDDVLYTPYQSEI